MSEAWQLGEKRSGGGGGEEFLIRVIKKKKRYHFTSLSGKWVGARTFSEWRTGAQLREL